MAFFVGRHLLLPNHFNSILLFCGSRASAATRPSIRPAPLPLGLTLVPRRVARWPCRGGGRPGPSIRPAPLPPGLPLVPRWAARWPRRGGGPRAPAAPGRPSVPRPPLPPGLPLVPQRAARWPCCAPRHGIPGPGRPFISHPCRRTVASLWLAPFPAPAAAAGSSVTGWSVSGVSDSSQCLQFLGDGLWHVSHEVA